MAYGAIAPPPLTAPLPTLAYALPNGHRLTVHPVTAHSAPLELAQFLHAVFNDELASTCFAVGFPFLMADGNAAVAQVEGRTRRKDH